MFLHVCKLVCFFHIHEYVLIGQENPIYITIACWPSPNWGVAGVIICRHTKVNRALWSSGQAGSIPASSIFLCL
jgi:hypothetical protein